MNVPHINRLTLWTLAPILVVIALALAPSAASATECHNEAVRAESNIDSTTGQPYDLSLPECRAYEMVSPLEKAAHSVEPEASGEAAAPNGEAVGFQSEGLFADAGNAITTFTPVDQYIARRRSDGWSTESTFAPVSLIDDPTLSGLSADFPSNMEASQVACGGTATTNAGAYSRIRCATRRGTGSWTGTPEYGDVSGTAGALLPERAFLGSSADLSRVFIQPTASLLPTDTISSGSVRGIYEVSGIGSASPELRLVNVDDSGNELEMSATEGPLFGGGSKGSTYQAVSESGEALFFTASPSGGVDTVFARLHHSETVAVSNPSPSECTRCTQEASEGKEASSEAMPATYQGAAASGEKVFFTTTQQLVNADTDATSDLYEYNFGGGAGHHVVQLSAGGLGDLTPGTGANVQGVVRTASDGSHVYFVATGALTSVPNSLGEIAQPGADNLYGVSTITGDTKFVADLCSGHEVSGIVADSECPTASSDSALWGEADNSKRDAQVTPDGDYLAFSTVAHLASEDTNNAQAAYRYDFFTGELTWISHAHPGFAPVNEAQNAIVAPLRGSFGGERDINDWNRAISESGEDVIFTTKEKLQADDVNGASDVYLWHDGEVSLISDGQAPKGVNLFGGLVAEPYAAISGSGDDIFFFSTTQLVAQDTDDLQDLYDARIEGGFPAPSVAPSCTSEAWACQGKGSEPPTAPKPEGSATQPAGGNLTAVPFKEVLESEIKPKSKLLTNAQKLAAALKVCKKTKSKTKRQACVRHARKEFSQSRKKKK